MQTAQRRTNIGQWCRKLCTSSSTLSQQSESALIVKERSNLRNNSLGITLTIKCKKDQSHKLKSMSSMQTNKIGVEDSHRKVYLSRVKDIRVSIDQTRKVELSVEMTTFVKEDSFAMEPKYYQPKEYSPRASNCSNPNTGLRQSESIFHNRPSNSKLDSSQGSFLLIRNEDDDEGSEQMRIKSLFYSRRMNTVNRMSMTNVLNSICEEAQAYEGFGIPTPKNDASFLKKKSEGRLVVSPFSRPRASDFGHNKTLNGATLSTANTTNMRTTRHSSYGSVAGCRIQSRKVPTAPAKPLRH